MDLSTSRLATVNQSSPVVHGLTDSNFGRSLLLNFENYYEIQIVDGFSSAKKTLGSCATMSFIDSTKGLGWELSFTPYSFNSFCALDSSIHSLSIIFLLLRLSVIYGSSSYSLLFLFYHGRCYYCYETQETPETQRGAHSHVVDASDAAQHFG